MAQSREADPKPNPIVRRTHRFLRRQSTSTPTVPGNDESKHQLRPASSCSGLRSTAAVWQERFTVLHEYGEIISNIRLVIRQWK
jgi:hypothetical protein